MGTPEGWDPGIPQKKDLPCPSSCGQVPHSPRVARKASPPRRAALPAHRFFLGVAFSFLPSPWTLASGWLPDPQGSCFPSHPSGGTPVRQPGIPLEPTHQQEHWRLRCQGGVAGRSPLPLTGEAGRSAIGCCEERELRLAGGV